MQDNKLSIGTGSDSTGVKEKATILSAKSQSPERSGGASSGSSGRSQLTDSGSAPSQSSPKPQATTQAKQRVALSTSTTSSQASSKSRPRPQATTQAKERAPLSTSTTSSRGSPQQAQSTTQAKVRAPLSTSTTSSQASSKTKPRPQATTQAKQRVALSTSTDSNPVSPRTGQQPQATTQAKQRVALSTSTTSSQSSPQQAQATTQAKVRVPLSTSTTSNPASPPVKQRPQATTPAKQRVALSTSTDSNPASSRNDQQPQATTPAKQRVALSTSTDSKPASSRIDQQPQATTQAKKGVPLSTSTDSKSVSSPANQAQVTTQAKKRVPLSTSTDSKPVSPPNNQAQDITQSRSRLPPLPTTSITADSAKTSSTTPSARARRALTSSEAVLTMQIQIRLIQAIKLLTASITTPATRAQASAHAHAALKYAIENNASPPLAARCAFYIAHAIYDPKDDNTTQNAVNWFQRATDAAEGDYPEGQWAQEWLNRYESLNMDSRPGSSSSWISRASESVWNAVFRGNSGPEDPDSAPALPLKPRPAPLWRLDENTRQANYSRAKGFQRIPSYSTWNSGETPSPTSAKEAGLTAPGSAKAASPIDPTSAKEASPTTPIHDYYDTYGVKWSPSHLYGKGKVINNQEFELVLSPDPFSPDRVRPIPEVEFPVEISAEQEERLRIHEAYFNGQVSPSALSWRARRQYLRKKGGGPSWYELMTNTEKYLPQTGKVLRVVNASPSASSGDGRSSSNKSGPASPAFSWEKCASARWEANGNLSLSMFPPPDAEGNQGPPVQQVYVPYRPPSPQTGKVLSVVNASLSASSGDGGGRSSGKSGPASPAFSWEKGASARWEANGNLSLSMFPPPDADGNQGPPVQQVYVPYRPPPVEPASATGLDVQRTLEDEAVQMEEGQSPRFGPVRSDSGIGGGDGEVMEAEEAGWFDGVGGELTAEERAE